MTRHIATCGSECYHTLGTARALAARCLRSDEADQRRRGRFVAFLAPYRVYFQVAQIIVSIALTISILLQARGAGLGSVFGGTGTVFKTRRGIDKLLFRFTIAFTVIFVVISVLGTIIPAK